MYTGKRHSDAMKAAVQDGADIPIRGAQGFVDDKGNFLDRTAAAQHALDCKEINKIGHLGILFSEDLW